MGGVAGSCHGHGVPTKGGADHEAWNDWEKRQDWSTREGDGKRSPDSMDSENENNDRRRDIGCSARACMVYRRCKGRKIKPPGRMDAKNADRSPHVSADTLRSRDKYEDEDPLFAEWSEEEEVKAESRHVRPPTGSGSTDTATASSTDTATTLSQKSHPQGQGRILPKLSQKLQRHTVFDDNKNWVDIDAVFAWTVTVIHARTKKKEEVVVYNNDKVVRLRQSFVQSTNCSPSIRLFYIRGTTCQELQDDWELRDCIKNRSSLIAYNGDLPELLRTSLIESKQGETRRESGEETETDATTTTEPDQHKMGLITPPVPHSAQRAEDMVMSAS